jgi:glucose-1-phosphate cytidylyltransferase
MNTFATQGFNEFIIALGYRGDVIKRYLLDLNELSGDISIDTLSKRISHLSPVPESSWKVTAIETGLNTQTGGRIKQCMQKFPGERLIVTYGDGLANISIPKLIAFHESHGKLATVTAVRPPARFGRMTIEDGSVTHFGEKNQAEEGWINGGFFVLEPQVTEYISGDDEAFEFGALPRLTQEKQLMANFHFGFWQPMDTMRERKELARSAELELPPWLKIDQ